MARNKMFSSVGRDLTEEINEGKTYKTSRRVDKIAVHCSYSPQGRGDDAKTIDKWHQQRWGSGVGYHYVVLEDGTIQKGRWVDSAGAHVKGHNSHTIGVCRIGGYGEGGKPVEDATPAQVEAIKKLTHLLVDMYGLEKTDILGHNEFPNVHKSCPLMDMNEIRN